MMWLQLRRQAGTKDPKQYAAQVVEEMRGKLNAEQRAAVEMAGQEELCVVTGAAGTGKTVGGWCGWLNACSFLPGKIVGKWLFTWGGM